MSQLTLDMPATDVQLVTIPNVELVSVGVWNASTGPVEFTPEHLQAAIAALADPAVHAPRLRIGHTPGNIPPEESAGGFAEQPAFGRFTNLRLGDNGATIVADAVGVPAWLAAILPAAFPSRSIEAYFDVTTAAGRTHDMVITSVALLGVSMPACETLEDLRLAFGAEMPDGVELQFTGDRVAASRGEPMPERVSASVTYGDMRTSFYNDFATQESGRYWWWIYDTVLSPPTVIANDDEDGLWATAYTVAGDTIEWGEPVEVRVQYVEKATGKVAASRPADESLQSFRCEYVAAGARLAAAPAEPPFTAASSRPADRVRAANDTNERSSDVDISTLREQLEMPDATDDEVIAAATERLSTSPSGEGDEPEIPESDAPQNDKTETVDKAQLEQMREDARLGREARLSQVRAEADRLCDDAVKDGRIAPASRASWRTAILPDDATELVQTEVEALAKLAKGRVPVERLSTRAVDTSVDLERRNRVRAAIGLTPLKKENV